MEQNTQPIPQTPPPAQPVPPPPNKNLNIFIGILIFILGIVVGLMLDKTTLLSTIRIPYLSVAPTPTPIPSPAEASAKVGTANWKTVTSDQFKFSLSYPPDWNYYNNANNDVLKLPYVRNFSSQNETLVKTNGCAIHFGFGGGDGPSNEIQSKNIMLDNITFNRKTWLVQNNPVFISYIYEGVPPANKKFELLLAWISQEDLSSCQNEIDQILSTFKFLEPSTTPPTTSYTCPPSGWVDCMPGTTPKPECSAAAMAWYKANCPDFKGGAL